MTKTERELVRDIRVVFARADHRVLNATQAAYVQHGAWLHAWAMQTLLDQMED